MPKKRAPRYDTKPSSPAHPSLAPAASSFSHSTSPSGDSVNHRIQQLRISQGTSPTPPRVYPGTAPSLPPSLRKILQLPDAPPPRPRPGLRDPRLNRYRGPAGPAPPQSWLERKENESWWSFKNRSLTLGNNGRNIQSLPGSDLPKQRTLLASTLKALAINWDWHVQFDQYYLATIPVRYKAVLLHDIARHSPNGIAKSGLDVLFLDETELQDATGVEGLTHLDLAASIDHRLKLSELKELFRTKKSHASWVEDEDSTPESWDKAEIFAFPSLPCQLHSLTHLSLAHPSPSVSWKGFLDLAPYLTTLTHLSLADWPTPTLTPNAKTAYRETPQGTVDYGASNFCSASDGDWTEAASILRRLGKSTYCLKWLDLTGCFPWVQALASDKIDWFGSWQALETVKVGQGWLPACFDERAGDEQAWRTIFPAYTTPQPPHPPERKQLAEWCRVERRTMDTEKAAATIISQTVKLAAEHATNDNDNENDAEASHSRPFSSQQTLHDDWEHTPASASASTHSRSSAIIAGRSPTTRMRLTFEYGWDAWWIRDAITEITDLGHRCSWYGF